jgi:hypothetical protein
MYKQATLTIIKPLESNVVLNITSEFSPYLKEKRTRNQYKHQFATLFKEIIHVYTENHTEPINTKCRDTDCCSGWYI